MISCPVHSRHLLRIRVPLISSVLLGGVLLSTSLANAQRTPEAGSGLSTGLVAGLKLDAAFWTNLEDNVCGQEGISDCEIDEFSWAPVVFSEYWYTPNLGVGFEGLYSNIELLQTFGEEPLFPSEVDVEMTTTAIGPYVTSRLGISDIVTLQFLLGMLYVWNSADFQSRFGGEVVSEEREDSGARLDVGTSVDVLLTERFGLRFNLDYTSGGADDTDTHVRGGVGVRVGSR